MPIDRDFLLNWVMDPVVESYTDREPLFYALSLGLGADPLDAGQLRFVYEKGLSAFPTMPVVMCQPTGWAVDPRAGLNYRMMLHGEQGLVVHRPLPVSGRLRGDTRVVEVIDKGEGRGALLYLERQITDAASGVLYATVKGTVFARADGGFGGPSGPSRDVHAIPAGEPDAVIDMPTLPQSALLYRLNGDRNPIHADPEAAQSAKFPQPILHGMCTYGVAAHAILKQFCNYDPVALRELDVRFSAPMFPGETVSVALWKRGAIVSFRARIKSRDATVLDNGRAVLAG
ncbi:MaoC family dehydratase [Aromatoleum aromaticum]|uniref:Predicted MaoC-like (R)-specific enoyl-CoA hydratase n=2 Tax=Aromatoleum aromaticum TaxID=551760 RepID=Q5P015_AROAE|nr:MaoC family dehydratase [Aromatoleum aromaticum]NMG54837.1 3-alpha,7-alpha,12-alpha-trihydroxy-5-beta-cholest-24-enoyl-CoA hydratase [Aromatoleum aromaticum]CAI09349.1 predicted MaoC-like (R)-specific enoyl-CoA hydratase [Aromatoleum aromaticum EbN1]